jgi:flagellar biosynthesis GTPase FlhF
MKKTLSLILALLMVAMLSTGVMAKSDNANARANSNKAKAVTSQKQQPPGQAKKNSPAPGQQKKNLQAPGQQKEKLQNSKQVEKVQKAEKKLIQERVKKSLQKKYRDSDNCQLKKAFVDTQQHWADQCINEMTAIGLLKGYPDGTFKPDQKLNQAEALSLIMRIAEDATDEDADEDVDEDKDEDDGELTDVPAWVRGDVDKAAKKGVIKLNRFHSAVQASRAQTAVMIAKALDLDPVDTSELPFKDGILISKEDVGYILALQQEGIISGMVAYDACLHYEC